MSVVQHLTCEPSAAAAPFDSLTVRSLTVHSINGTRLTVEPLLLLLFERPLSPVGSAFAAPRPDWPAPTRIISLRQQLEGAPKANLSVVRQDSALPIKLGIFLRQDLVSAHSKIWTPNYLFERMHRTRFLSALHLDWRSEQNRMAAGLEGILVFGFRLKSFRTYR